MELFENIVHKDNVPFNMDVPTEPKSISQFIDSWRVKLWDKGFPTVFKGTDHFKKSDSFKDFKGSDLVVKCVVYRYYSFILNWKILSFLHRNVLQCLYLL